MSFYRDRFEFDCRCRTNGTERLTRVTALNDNQSIVYKHENDCIDVTVPLVSFPNLYLDNCGIYYFTFAVDQISPMSVRIGIITDEYCNYSCANIVGGYIGNLKHYFALDGSFGDVITELKWISYLKPPNQERVISKGDTVVMCVNMETRQVSYILNGSDCGIAFSFAKHKYVSPCVTLLMNDDRITLSNVRHIYSEPDSISKASVPGISNSSKQFITYAMVSLTVGLVGMLAPNFF